MPRYSLPSHVHFCVTEGGAVFLDLRRDSYIGIGTAQIPAIRTLMNGSSEQPEHVELVRSLLERGLITDRCEGSRPLAPPSLVPATAVLANVYEERKVHIKYHHVIAFISAYLKTSITLRCISLERVVARVRNRKSRYARNCSSFDYDHARELIDIFRVVRPWVYVPEGKCLFNSLVLAEFLSHYEIYPTWVIAVRTKPFRAHSWLQSGEFLFNDEPGFSGAYTPILSV